jgi:hypothetical protein
MPHPEMGRMANSRGIKPLLLGEINDDLINLGPFVPTHPLREPPFLLSLSSFNQYFILDITMPPHCNIPK